MMFSKNSRLIVVVRLLFTMVLTVLVFVFTMAVVEIKYSPTSLEVHSTILSNGTLGAGTASNCW